MAKKIERKHHRKVWVRHHGPIPKDEESRSYEIHHINGDHNDNRIENLRCISILEHYKTHLDQGDWAQAAAVGQRMEMHPDIVRGLNKLGGLKAAKDKKGFHALSKEENRKNGLKGAIATIGYRWWTDGKKETRSPKQPGRNWRIGRLNPNYIRVKKGTRLGDFWNNGEKNKRAVECPGPGWVRGRFLTEKQRERRREIAREVTKRRWKKNESY